VSVTAEANLFAGQRQRKEDGKTDPGSVARRNRFPEQFQADLGCPDGNRKIFRFIRIIFCARIRSARALIRGRNAIVTERRRGLRWTLWRQCDANRTDENACSVRRSRVVLAPRSWRQVGGKYPADDGGKKRRSPGRARSKPSNHCAGKAGMSWLHLWFNPCAFFRYFRTRDFGRSRRPAFPAPSILREGR
jgi:hypothetical protein